MTVAAWAGVALSVLCLVPALVNLASVAIAWRRFRPPVGRLAPPAGAEPVSLVRPVCGLEPFSEETLASGFRLDYPAYELIFGVARADDPIVPVVERLIAAHPGVPARLVVGDVEISHNPKLNNCVRGWDAAAHDWVVLADSNVLTPPDYLQRLLAAWRPDTGLVCSTPIGSRPGGFWAEVECAFLNAHQARWQYVGEAFGLGFAQGKSMLWRKSFLDRHGGIRALAAEIAEDAAATKLVRAAGLHVHLVDAPFEQPLGPRGAREVVARQFRWARLRRVTFPLFFAPEIFTGAVVPLAAGLAAGVLGVIEAVAFLAVWYGAETALARRMGWFVSWRSPLAMLARDLVFPFVWAYAYWGRGVVWRGNAMVIGAPRPARTRRALLRPEPIARFRRTPARPKTTLFDMFRGQ